MSNFFVDWFSQQDEFTTDMEAMNKEELNKCLRKFYMSARKQDGGYYDEAALTSIRSAIDRHLCNEPHNKPFSIISDSQFTEANEALNSFLKTLSKSCQIYSTVQKPALTIEAVSKLYEASELVRCKMPRSIKTTANSVVFYNSLLWSKRKGKPASIDKIKPKALQNPKFRPGIF